MILLYVDPILREGLSGMKMLPTYQTYIFTWKPMICLRPAHWQATITIHHSNFTKKEWISIATRRCTRPTNFCFNAAMITAFSSCSEEEEIHRGNCCEHKQKPGKHSMVSLEESRHRDDYFSGSYASNASDPIAALEFFLWNRSMTDLAISAPSARPCSPVSFQTSGFVRNPDAQSSLAWRSKLECLPSNGCSISPATWCFVLHWSQGSSLWSRCWPDWWTLSIPLAIGKTLRYCCRRVSLQTHIIYSNEDQVLW